MTNQLSITELTDVIFKQNPNIKLLTDAGEIFKVLDIRCHKNNDRRFQAVIRVSEQIRKTIKNNCDRVYVGTSSCPVFDRFHIQRCNKCQKLNHFQDRCKATTPICGYCAKNHNSTECPSKSNVSAHCCASCQDNKFRGVKNSHNAFDTECPSYKAAQERLKLNIPYYNTKN